MTDSFRFAQLQSFALAGGGAIAGATSITLKSMTDIDGNALSMATDFGTIGFGTLEPGNGALEEQISFTGLTNNTNGTVTLTGVSSVTFVYPYTQTSGLAKTHAGSTTFVISNTSGFYDRLTAKGDDETITGLWDFPSGANNPTIGNVTYVAPTTDTQIATKKYVDDVSIAGGTNATTTTQGLVELATQAEVDAGTAIGGTGASLVATPAVTRSRLLSDYVNDTGIASAYAIAPSPVITAYVTGQRFIFKALTANVGATTLAVNALSATTIFKAGGPNQNASSLSTNDIVLGQIVEVIKAPNGFQMLTPLAGSTPTGAIQMYAGDETSAVPRGWLICNGSAVNRTTYAPLFALLGTNYGTGDGSTTFNLPDMRGRVPIGVGTGTGGGASGTGLPTGGSALTAVSRGTWQGEETHVLVTAEMPAHQHTYIQPSVTQAGTGGGSVLTTTTSGLTAPTGGDGAHNNLQPLMGVNFIIKT